MLQQVGQGLLKIESGSTQEPLNQTSKKRHHETLVIKIHGRLDVLLSSLLSYVLLTRYSYCEANICLFDIQLDWAFNTA